MSKSHRDEEPHILIIEDVDEEEQTFDWSIEHLESCGTEELEFGGDFEQKHEPMTYTRHTCSVQNEIDYSGLDCLIDSEGNEVKPWTLKPGQYKIVFFANYYPGEFGGSYGEEWDTGLELVQ